MTQRQTMITWTAKRVRESNREDVENQVEELFSEMSHNGHRWAKEIEQYSWSRFVADVERVADDPMYFHR